MSIDSTAYISQCRYASIHSTIESEGTEIYWQLHYACMVAYVYEGIAN